MVVLLINNILWRLHLEGMSCPDNSYSIRMRRLKQKQDALYARNTTGSQLMQPFNYNISPTGNMGNQFMLGTVAGSKNEVNTSPFGHVNEDIACTCTVAVETAASGPPPPGVLPNIRLMIPGSLYGFCNLDTDLNKTCVFKMSTDASQSITYQTTLSAPDVPSTFIPYLMEKDTNYIYIAGYTGASTTTTYLVILNALDGTFNSKKTFTNQIISGISSIGTDLYITSISINIAIPSIVSYINIYNNTTLSVTNSYTYNNTIIRGKILKSGTNYYAIVYNSILPSGFPIPTGISYNIQLLRWATSALGGSATASTSLFTTCALSFANLGTFNTEPKLLSVTPIISTISSNTYILFAECVNGFTITSPPAPFNGLTFYGYNITTTTQVFPVLLGLAGTITPYISNLYFVNGYFYMIAGQTTNRIYGIQSNLTTAITASAATTYSAVNGLIAVDSGTNVYRVEYDGSAYSFVQYTANGNLALQTTPPRITLTGYITSVAPNIVFDTTNSSYIYLNDSSSSVQQYVISGFTIPKESVPLNAITV